MNFRACVGVFSASAVLCVCVLFGETTYIAGIFKDGFKMGFVARKIETGLVGVIESERSICVTVFSRDGGRIGGGELKRCDGDIDSIRPEGKCVI